jgi:hypothetical protein
VYRLCTHKINEREGVGRIAFGNTNVGVEVKSPKTHGGWHRRLGGCKGVAPGKADLIVRIAREKNQSGVNRA